MSATVTTRMSGDDMVVRVKGTDDRTVARKLAQQAAGTHFVGATTPHDKGGFVIRVSAKSLAARKVSGKVPPASAIAPKAPKAPKAPAWNPAELLTLALQGDPVSAQRLVELLGTGAEAEAPRAERELPAFLQKAPVTCETCRDHGVVRKLGKHAGEPYKTADGAAAATANGNAVKCPSHKKARRAA